MPHVSNLRLLAGALAVATALAVVPASSASASGAAPDAWAHSVCGALGSWVHDVEAASDKVAGSKPTSTKNVRAKLTKLLVISERETKVLLAALRRAGQPDVQGGKQLAATIREGLVQVQRTITGAKKTLAKAPTKNPDAFLNATRSAQDSLEAGLEGVQAAFSAVRAADVEPLRAAFVADTRCRKVAR